jgi:hypothetical protein
LERVDRIRGRPAHAFLFRPPPDFAQAHPEIGAARAYLDTQFNAMMQTELLSPKGAVLKSFSLVSLKRIGEQTLPKSVDFRNDVTRDKTRLQVTAVALRQTFPATVFTPAGLTGDVRPPEALVRLDP